MRQITPEDERLLAKPILIILPAGLIQQWIDEIQVVAPVLKIYKYHGDRRAKPIGNWTVINKLGLNHSLCQNLEDNARSVIFTTLGTLGVRHGPRALASYLRKEKGMTKKMAAEAMYHYQDFPDSLKGLFQLVVLDEAHTIKNMDTEANVSLHWLNASFYLFLTATSMSAGANDFEGYLKLLERPDLNLYDERNLKAWDVEDWVNPYRLNDDHPAAVLRLTRRAAKEFIFRNSIAPQLKEDYVRQIWKQCLLRRTYTSTMPFGSSRIIGSAMPRIQASILECRFSKNEVKFYSTHIETMMSKLIVKDNKTHRLRWSFGVLRKITLACM